ncbi:DUF4082 domain-containing protein [Agromyces protaetiae]|uniref:DUF4082 domain-containing protein n=1 Tax=Agromyces protaetiae TaxID=2509455 RepID=UPI0013EB071A|nr:DUF4082 domain-containing protein [Agromyces protaetiae]
MDSTTVVSGIASIRPQRATRRRVRRLTAAIVAAAALVGGAVLTPWAAAAVSPAVGVISDGATPEIASVPDSAKIELGTRFSPTTAGTLSGVQFYQNVSNSGVTSASVWSSTGALLARVSVNPSAAIGWRTVPVDVDLTAGATYTVSVFDSNGKFPATSGAFTRDQTINGIAVPANAGVYRYANSTGFPSSTAGAEGYSLLVDVVFTSDATVAPPSPTPTPTPTPTPAPEPDPGDGAAEPEPAPEQPDVSTSFGPDGSHWPARTPHADGARTVRVAASWSAIASAITANANSTDPVVVCVSPGTIPGGNGSASSSKGVLQSIGNAARASRILVTPCDGVGTVKVGTGAGVAFVGVRGVSIVGIDFSAQPVMVRNSESFALGFTEVPTLLVTANADNGVRDVEIVEVVAGSEQTNGATGDRVEVKSAGGFDIDGLRFAGFYAAPNYKPNKASTHIDTLQFVTTSGDGTISNVTIEDSALFQSSDQGIMAGGNVGGTIRHSAFFGGTTGQLRYPMYAGGDPITLANLWHGAWSGLTVTDSVVAGSISPAYSFASVSNSKSSDGARGFGRLGTLTLADIDALVPVPSPARLAAIWN